VTPRLRFWTPRLAMAAATCAAAGCVTGSAQGLVRDERTESRQLRFDGPGPHTLDARTFSGSIRVTGEPRIRFYAGAPLTLNNGTHAGTLCVIDHRARNLDNGQLQLLRDLAKLVEQEFQPRPAVVRN
jgi:GAF domain-containing protein